MWVTPYLLPVYRLSGFTTMSESDLPQKETLMPVPSLPEPAGASAKPPTRSTSRPQLSKTQSEIRRSAIRIRVGGGTQYIEDPRSIEEAERAAAALAAAKEDATSAKQQVLRLKQRFADARETIAEKERLAADFEAEIQMLTSSHRNEVQMLTAQLEASEAAKRQALKVQQQQQQTLEAIVRQRSAPQTPAAGEGYEEGYRAERKARLRAEEALRKLQAEQTEDVPELQQRLDEALARAKEVAEELAASERQRAKEVRAARAMQEELVKRCSEWQGRAEKAEAEVATYRAKEEGEKASAEAKAREAAAKVNAAERAEVNAALYGGGNPGEVGDGKEGVVPPSPSQTNGSESEEVAALRRERNMLLQALKERRAACEELHDALTLALSVAPSTAAKPPQSSGEDDGDGDGEGVALPRACALAGGASCSPTGEQSEGYAAPTAAAAILTQMLASGQCGSSSSLNGGSSGNSSPKGLQRGGSMGGSMGGSPRRLGGSPTRLVRGASSGVTAYVSSLGIGAGAAPAAAPAASDDPNDPFGDGSRPPAWCSYGVPNGTDPGAWRSAKARDSDPFAAADAADADAVAAVRFAQDVVDSAAPREGDDAAGRAGGRTTSRQQQPQPQPQPQDDSNGLRTPRPAAPLLALELPVPPDSEGGAVDDHRASSPRIVELEADGDEEERWRRARDRLLKWRDEKAPEWLGSGGSAGGGKAGSPDGVGSAAQMQIPVLLQTRSAGAAAAVRAAFGGLDGIGAEGGAENDPAEGDYYVWPSGSSAPLSASRTAAGEPTSVLLRSTLASRTPSVRQPRSRSGSAPSSSSSSSRTAPKTAATAARTTPPNDAPRRSLSRGLSGSGLYGRDRELVVSVHDPRAHWP